MATFGKLSNKTRELLRPPKTVLLPAGSALFYEIPRTLMRQQPGPKNANKNQQHEEPNAVKQPPAGQRPVTTQRAPDASRPSVTQLPKHQADARKNVVNGQNGHSAPPSNTPKSSGQTGSPGRPGSSMGSRSSNLFPSVPRQNTQRQNMPPARRDADTPQRGSPSGNQRPNTPPVRPTPTQETRPENKPSPNERQSSPPPPSQEKNGRSAPSGEGNRGGASGSYQERRSAWLPSTPASHGSSTPPARPVQVPLEPEGEEEQPRPAQRPENRVYQPRENQVRPAPQEPDERTPDVKAAPAQGQQTTEDRLASAPVRPAPNSSNLSPRQTTLVERSESTPGIQQQPGPTGLSAAAMERILSRFSDLPAQSALLGLCDDGLPVMLDLYDSSPGAMAIIGDEREVQIEMLRSIIASAAMRNSPRALQFVVLSMQVDSWQKWITERGFDRYSLGVVPANEETAREWILRLADWTEDRRTGRRSGPPVLFIMDTLSFLPRLELDARLNFDWLAKEGPIAAIWPVAAISTDLASSLGSRLAHFGSKVLGYAEDPSLYIRVANVDPAETAEFRKRGEFAVRLGENWLRFRVAK